MEVSERQVGRLSIAYLLAVTAGVGAGITLARAIIHLRFPADAFYYKLESVADLDAFGLLAAAIYGVCIVTFAFALRSSDFWSSPGKSLALLFAMMCTLDWTLQIVAATVTSLRLQFELAPGAVDTRGYILGIWYLSFPPSIGYIVGLPVVLLVVFKSQPQPLAWRLAWVGFLIFSMLMVGIIHFDLLDQIPGLGRNWFFEFAIGIPIALLTAALLLAILRRQHLDWWTGILVPLIIATWGLSIAIKVAGV